ncbi:hypothetical protein U9M48_037604 [Paspalum notatum var. saurae]|uniref:Uncharacterized protein n=1 Tax=Paspalum notatum var. saurae TaxID=547442 RepID=A0AAQ3ULJ9_PASNO
MPPPLPPPPWPGRPHPAAALRPTAPGRRHASPPHARALPTPLHACRNPVAPPPHTRAAPTRSGRPRLAAAVPRRRFPPVAEGGHRTPSPPLGRPRPVDAAPPLRPGSATPPRRAPTDAARPPCRRAGSPPALPAAVALVSRQDAAAVGKGREKGGAGVNAAAAWPAVSRRCRDPTAPRLRRADVARPPRRCAMPSHRDAAAARKGRDGAAGAVSVRRPPWPLVPLPPPSLAPARRRAWPRRRA